MEYHYQELNFCIDAQSDETMRKLLCILAKWNEFPKQELLLMRKLIEAGKNWKQLFEGEEGEKFKKELQTWENPGSLV